MTEQRLPLDGFVQVALIDRRGWILLQERDEHAPVDPERWGVPGGNIESDESVLAAAVREIQEETAIELTPDVLTLVGEFDVYVPRIESTDHLWFYATPVDLSDDAIECHEGRQIVFVAPDDARHLPLAAAAKQALLPFLDSALYRSFAS